MSELHLYVWNRSPTRRPPVMTTSDYGQEVIRVRSTTPHRHLTGGLDRRRPYLGSTRRDQCIDHHKGLPV